MLKKPEEKKRDISEHDPENLGFTVSLILQLLIRILLLFLHCQGIIAIYAATEVAFLYLVSFNSYYRKVLSRSRYCSLLNVSSIYQVTDIICICLYLLFVLISMLNFSVDIQIIPVIKECIFILGLHIGPKQKVDAKNKLIKKSSIIGRGY